MMVVTDKAAEELKSVLPKFAPDLDLTKGAVRVMITGQCGCGKIHYGMDVTPEVKVEDMTFEVSGLRFALDPRVSELLDGAELDYEEGVMHSGFRINNPNEQGGCTCGH